jgi:hypothetical protein
MMSMTDYTINNLLSKVNGKWLTWIGLFLSAVVLDAVVMYVAFSVSSPIGGLL